MRCQTIWFLFLSVSVLSLCPLPVQAQERVDTHSPALDELENYSPPPMFGGSSQRIESPYAHTPPPSSEGLTPEQNPEEQTGPSPDPAALLGHPVKSGHVLTIQKPATPLVRTPSIAAPLAPKKPDLPQTTENQEAKSPEQKPKASQEPLPPLPDRKPALIAKTEQKIEPKTETKTTPKTQEIIATHTPKAEKARNAEKPDIVTPDIVTIEATRVKKPKATKAQKMPAVPAVKVERTALPDLPDKAILPDVDPAQPPKPSIGERMMDDALNRNMTKDEGQIKEVLGLRTPQKTDIEMNDLDQFSVAFKEGVAELVADQKKLIAGSIVSQMKKDKNTRVQIKAYASRTDGTESAARRISLSRALSARAFLLEKGISPTRIDVKALGNRTTEHPVDRIDLTLVKPE